MIRLLLAALLLCIFCKDVSAKSHHIPAACVETGTPMRPVCMGQDNNPFSGARSITVTMHRERHASRLDFRGKTTRPDGSVVEFTDDPRTVPHYGAPKIISHPAGCPATAFCGCGAAVRVFGHSVRELWLAANWFKFPRAAPAPGMAAVRRHHVFVLEADLGGGVWQVFDANSGHHLTRVHARSLAGFVIVNPHGAG